MKEDIVEIKMNITISGETYDSFQHSLDRCIKTGSRAPTMTLVRMIMGDELDCAQYAAMINVKRSISNQEEEGIVAIVFVAESKSESVIAVNNGRARYQEVISSVGVLAENLVERGFTRENSKISWTLMKPSKVPDFLISVGGKQRSLSETTEIIIH